jgi:hypothetical protein
MPGKRTKRDLSLVKMVMKQKMKRWRQRRRRYHLEEARRKSLGSEWMRHKEMHTNRILLGEGTK